MASLEYLYFCSFFSRTDSAISILRPLTRSTSPSIYISPAVWVVCFSVREPEENIFVRYSLICSVNFPTSCPCSSTSSSCSLVSPFTRLINFWSVSPAISLHLVISFLARLSATVGCPISLSSRNCGREGSLFSLVFASGMTFITIFTISQISGIQINVITILKLVCAFAICREIT